MGVSLKELVTAKEISFEYLSGRTIAIDAYNMCYQFLSIIRDKFTGEPLKDSRGNVTSHLSGLFYRSARLLEAGITPVFIFDGKPPDFKRHTIESRVKIRQEAAEKWKKALKEGDTEAVRRYSQAAVKFTAEMVEESKKLLEAMGISWVQAPSEGEAQAAFYSRKGTVFACGSQDWDSLLFGAKRLVRNLSVSGRRKVAMKEKYIEVSPELVVLEDFLSELGISQDQLIMLGMLVGTDYNPGGIKGIGPKTALKLVREHETLEKVFENVEWPFEMQPKDIFNFFRKPPAEDIDIREQRMSPERIMEVLVEGHDFSRDKVESVLKKLGGSAEQKKQTGLGKFF